MCEIMEKIQNEGIAIGRAEGKAEGRIEGRAEGEARFGSLVGMLMSAGKSDDIVRAISDSAYRSQLYEKYHI